MVSQKESMRFRFRCIRPCEFRTIADIYIAIFKLQFFFCCSQMLCDKNADLRWKRDREPILASSGCSILSYHNSIMELSAVATSFALARTHSRFTTDLKCDRSILHKSEKERGGGEAKQLICLLAAGHGDVSAAALRALSAGT